MDIRLYILDSELTDFRSSLNADGYGNGANNQAFLDDSLRVTETRPSPINLNPLDNGGVAAKDFDPDNTTFTASGYSLYISTDDVGEFVPGMIPNLPNAALPITLMNFWLEKNGQEVDLYWTVASEIFLSHYRIERSTDLVNWTTLAEPEAQMKSTMMEYTFTDKTPLSGINYYRLWSVDEDNTQRVEGIRSAEFIDITSDQVNVYPNPFDDQVFIRLPKTMAATGAELEIFNVLGAKVYSGQLTGSATHRLELDLAPGTYNFVFSSPQGLENKSVVVTE